MTVNFTFTLSQINAVAKEFLAATAAYRVIAFHGDMGAGKTTFIHSLCEAMGVGDTIASPTFSIINQYSTATGQTIYHMDLYRIKDEEEAITAGVEDCLYSENTCLVEWPEKAPGIFPDNTLHVFMELLDKDKRQISWQ
jgi:tRNA threonylcarbamoyladenosine biosynthesis protein TsaE